MAARSISSLLCFLLFLVCTLSGASHRAYPKLNFILLSLWKITLLIGKIIFSLKSFPTKVCMIWIVQFHLYVLRLFSLIFPGFWIFSSSFVNVNKKNWPTLLCTDVNFDRSLSGQISQYQPSQPSQPFEFLFTFNEVIRLEYK